jgi:hypothetical protein
VDFGDDTPFHDTDEPTAKHHYTKAGDYTCGVPKLGSACKSGHSREGHEFWHPTTHDRRVDRSEAEAGTYDAFRKAWEPDDWPPQWEKAYHVRNVNDENEVISFGFFNGTLEELQDTRPGGGGEEERQSRMAEFVDSTGADGLYKSSRRLDHPARPYGG